MLPPPRYHLIRFHVEVFCSKPFLYKHDLRVVIAVFSEDVSTTCPGAYHVEGKTETRTGICVAEYVVWILEPLARCAGRRVVRCHVVTEAACFVKADH